MPVILATWEAELGRITVPWQPRQIAQETPISKITGGVEHLLFKREVLSSDPSPTEKERRRKEEGRKEGRRKEGGKEGGTEGRRKEKRKEGREGGRKEGKLYKSKRKKK
jgi:hypothetical protein